MRRLLILVFIDFIFSSSVALGVLDKEINESQKCSRMFSYFEKKYKLPKDILHSISLQESQKPHSKYKIGIVWPWVINVEGKGHYFKSKYEAVQFTKQLILSGKTSIDVGCMQISLKYHPDAFASLHQAFSPMNNIEYAAQLLRSHYEKHGKWHKAVGHYHSATADKALSYHTNVKKINVAMVAYKKSLEQYSNPYRSESKHVRQLSNNTTMQKGINISKMKTNNLFRRVQ